MPATAKDDPKKQEAQWHLWKTRIDDALKREKKYREQGHKVVDIYEAKQSDQVPYAILYSNTEVTAPAVYNAKPIPVVQRRFRDEDPIGKAIAEVSTRTLKFLIDNESADFDSFDDLINPAVLEGLLVNRGLTRFKYRSEGETETVCGESVRWDKFFHGYARTWKKVPWIGFEWDMTKEEIKRNFPVEGLDFGRYSEAANKDDDQKPENEDEKAGVELYTVYEIWDKSDRKVKFFSAVFPHGALREVDDPLGLSTFFPIPKPLNFMKKVTTLVPTPLYEQYRQQALELNDITRRLKAIIKAIKYRGAYNSTVEGIEKMLNADDNELVPVENMSSMPENTTIDRLLYTVPTNELAQTALALYQQREQCKGVIYEITGISDIIRGASRASETATAQEIKNQWGSLRLKKMQKEVQRYVREALAIIVEIAAAKFDQRTFIQMTGLQFPLLGQKQQMQMQLQSAMQQAQAMGQEMPPIPPEIQEMLNAPAWEEILGPMKSDIVLKYKVDIETNSTIDAEAAQDKQDISELMNAMSQLFMALTPLVEKGFMPFDVAKDMLMVITRRYNFGSQIEDSLMKMAAPQKQDDGEAQAKQIEMQMKQQENQQKAQLSKMDFDHKMALMAQENKTAMLNAQIAENEARLRAQAVEMKMQQQAAAHRQKMEQLKQQEKMAESKDKEPA